MNMWLNNVVSKLYLESQLMHLFHSLKNKKNKEAQQNTHR